MAASGQLNMMTVTHGIVSEINFISDPWNIGNSKNINKKYDFSTQDTGMTDVYITDDGLNLYACGAGAKAIFQYSLSTPWDITTIAYTNKSLDISPEIPTLPIHAIEFSADGLSLYVLESLAGNDRLYLYTLTTALDLATASYSGIVVPLGSNNIRNGGMYFSRDGSNIVTFGYDGVASTALVRRGTLSTPWDITTIADSGVALDVTTEITSAGVSDVVFKPDGLVMYLLGRYRTVAQYSLTIPFDLSTVSYSGVSIDLFSGTANTGGLAFKPTGDAIIVIDSSTGEGNSFKL